MRQPRQERAVSAAAAETFVGAGSGVARREGGSRPPPRLPSPPVSLVPGNSAVRVRGNVSMIDSKRTCPANRRRRQARARACLLACHMAGATSSTFTK